MLVYGGVDFINYLFFFFFLNSVEVLFIVV